jgi:hypothetical protein
VTRILSELPTIRELSREARIMAVSTVSFVRILTKFGQRNRTSGRVQGVSEDRTWNGMTDRSLGEPACVMEILRL